MRCLASQVRRSDPHVGQKGSTFDYPGATFTGATGINQRGDILGRYTNADNLFHGFLMTGFRPPCVATTSTPQTAAITHASDFTLITASKPAAAGEVLSIFAKGLGPTRPGVGSGQPFPSSTLAPVDSLVEVRVNGRSAIVLGAYGFPGSGGRLSGELPFANRYGKGNGRNRIERRRRRRHASKHRGPVSRGGPLNW